MSDEAAFVAAACDRAEDDTLRLVYADWLDERGAPGDAALAEFVRLSVAAPACSYWQNGSTPVPMWGPPAEDPRARELCSANWGLWTEALRTRLGTSPLAKWLGKDDCGWAYRRGLIASFRGTQQVLLDAWTDLFVLGPIETVKVTNLWHLGTVLSLRQILDRPSVRSLVLESQDLRADCVERLQGAWPWFQRLKSVQLWVRNPNYEAEGELRAWLAANPALRHVRYHRAP